MVLFPVALRAREAHVGPLGPLTAKCSSSSSLVFGPLWHSLAPFGMEAKFNAKAPLAPLAPRVEGSSIRANPLCVDPTKRHLENRGEWFSKRTPVLLLGDAALLYLERR